MTMVIDDIEHGMPVIAMCLIGMIGLAYFKGKMIIAAGMLILLILGIAMWFKKWNAR